MALFRRLVTAQRNTSLDALVIYSDGSESTGGVVDQKGWEKWWRQIRGDT
jgi:hypothetical protein